MSRRISAQKRGAGNDFKYGDRSVSQFIACLMKEGKRSTAERIMYSAIDLLEKKSGQSGIEMFRKAMNNVKPVLEVKSRRVGGATYQVPTEVRPDRRTALAIRWLITYSMGRSEKSMSDKLAAEFLAAANNEGASIKKKEDTHKMAEANKAFAHFKW
ncbi:30S ribosomal protein S7 [candidate division GN15 bacterium]|uniref:Small ribosomal subunit protein uS7 n=1 Tax=candidate division GN15 bacterium TaxID=2072418 RepID=A0A855X7Z8_9BACT|nr:MAG: 30S ribosomal protein S7 [candidate division GN15 bacterium]